MATPNYGWEKRQRELAKKKKKEEKALRKADPRPAGEPESGPGNEQGSTGSALNPSSAEPQQR